MLNVHFTVDYEIHGNGDGCPYALMVEPTQRTLDLLESHGARLTIMADVGEILAFGRYLERTGQDDYHFEAIVAQLQEAIRRGHDVQLHLHCSYLNAVHEGGEWRQDWSEYDFAGLPLERLIEVVGMGKRFLEDTLRPIDQNYRCNSFRAANWSMSPSQNVVRALLHHGITVDSSVFKGGKRSGMVTFDYSNAPSNLVPWPASAEDICVRDENSDLLEAPIYCENRRITAFATPQRLYRAWLSRKHKFTAAGSARPEGPAPSSAAAATPKPGKLRRLMRNLTQPQAWKADFNQCSGRQLIGALERAAAAHDRPGETLPFITIGHSKLFTPYNERSLEPFLRYVADRPERFGFGVLSDLARDPEQAPALEPSSATTA